MNENRLWYNQAAKEWNEALPIGNGRLGAMLFGEVEKEHIQLNEESVWYGGYRDRNNPDALKNLPKIRELLFAGKVPEAEELMLYALSSTPFSERTYQTLGDFYLKFKNPKGEIQNYKRELDISKAVHTISYEINGYWYKRECFSTAADDCIVIKIETNSPEGISLDTYLTRGKFYDYSRKVSDNSTIMGGNLGKDGLDFAGMVKALAKGGTTEIIGERIVIRNAEEVLIFINGATTFRCDNVEKYLKNFMEKVTQKSYEQLKNNHIKDYQKIYNTMKLEISDKENDLPTDIRKINFEESDDDNGLLELYFNYGRYLLISCSREGCLPANLQGLWNEKFTPSWDSKYTININTEMNYWPAEICNLSSCHKPLFDMIKRMLPNGRITARKMYNCKGFVAHHNTDLWADTAVQDLWNPGSYWVMGAAWLCTHMWIHYEYSMDKEFLKEAYPIMKEAAEFFEDFLVEHEGYLVTCPSVSPENRFILPSGVVGANTYGVSMDNQILRDLLSGCIKAAEILELGEDETVKFKEIINKLRPDTIGKYGQLMEWYEDYEEKDKGHRHISHLYALCPSNQITVDETPELAEAARVTLERRLANGGGHTGWSRAWIINNYAKLWDSEKAYENLRQLIIKSTLLNLFDNHPPFQIDGNFGGTAGIAQMLVQSTTERIVLLPALPEKWQNGKVEGICARGGIELNLEWKNHKLVKCEVYAKNDVKTKLKYSDKVFEIELKKGERKLVI